MLAVDTNILVRYLTNDDASQSAQARTFINKNDVLLTATVLLESDWVLRSTFDYPRQDAVESLRAFCGLPTVTLDQAAVITQAFDWALQGMDFADALHMAASRQCEAFVSFDGDLAKVAKRSGALEVRRP
ncbi:MAG TPA: type II toxin-antitoxin system VapC family toxin [Vitreimonas sp.]|uniref:type II toxin-antitoxin system VapC family toxin n=1 Tax=Vitreimonas sp. TaxID=3069702 RepID=UPI002D25BF7D|nr:type II toxin-antitoxin system VapC family toxin [Vitreimonas sp.]HYD87647.1 type II toxin-antitoxin system VapC family toxin [Vitreimonas sp.]